MRRPLMMMRMRGLAGPKFCDHHGVPGLSKSAGNFIGTVGVGPRVITAYITNAIPTSVIVVFNGAVTGNVAGGVTYTLNGGAPQSFNRATNNGDGTVTYSVNEAPWGAGDVIRWLYTPGNIQVGGEDLPAQDVLVDNQILGVPQITSIRSFENRIQNGSTVIRQPIIEVTYDQVCTITDASGITVTVQGGSQIVSYVGGSGTFKHQFNVSRAIFRHAVTFAYNSSLGNIIGEGGDPLEDFGPTQVSNEAPSFTVWDWNPGATNGFDSDTQWDGDESRFDE